MDYVYTVWYCVDMNRDQQIHIRVSTQEKELLEWAAEQNDSLGGISEFMRALSLHHATAIKRLQQLEKKND